MRNILTLLSLYVAINFFNPAIADTDYPNTAWMAEYDKNADWYKQCHEVAKIEPPKNDLPSEKLVPALQRCDAIDLYYSTKSEANPTKDVWQKVRHCAFATNDDVVLMMLYANGFGVPKNIKLAIRYACRVGGAPAEAESRISHLARLEADNNEPFDLCDNVTSGSMAGVCASNKEQRNAKARNARINNIVKSWTPSQKALFASLRGKLNDFVTLRGPEETDQSGSARDEFVTGTIADEYDQFVDSLEKFEKGEFPQFTNEQLAELDKELNQTYLKIMHSKPEQTGTSLLGFSTVSKEGIKKTQRAWLKYRDAWIAFGQARWPSVEARSWQAYFTDQRIAELNDLLLLAM